MPTYQYACTDADCGNRSDLALPPPAPPAGECPVCSSPVRKVYGSVGVVFKGSGFYRTDSRAAAGKGSSSSSSSSDSSSAGSGSNSSSSSSSSSSTSSSSSSGSTSKAAAS